MIIRFIIYGMIGWTLEILFTGVSSLFKKDLRLTSTTYLWMFPIYGMVVLLEPFFIILYGLPLVLRGGIYTLLIFAAEYATGFGLRKMVGVSPWNYKTGRLCVDGLIRLDYAPLWFIVGLFYEFIYFWYLA